MINVGAGILDEDGDAGGGDNDGEEAATPPPPPEFSPHLLESGTAPPVILDGSMEYLQRWTGMKYIGMALYTLWPPE